MTASPESSQYIGPFIDPPAASLTAGLRHIEPIVYGDIFDYPPTLEEIWRYCPLPLTREQVSRRLDDRGPATTAADLVQCRNGYYHLHGREELVDLRIRRATMSRIIWKRARRVASLLQHIPFILSMAVTGSLTTDNADQDGDPDFLVITARNRIWTVFFFLGTIQKLTSTRTLCPNFYISEDSLQIAPRDYYNAREIAQAIPLMGPDLFDRFLEANHWVKDYFPNYRRTAHREEQPLPAHRLLRLLGRMYERVTAGRLGDALERLFRRLLFHRLACHYRTFGGEAPVAVLDAAQRGLELRFHGLHHRALIREAIEERVSRLQHLLSAQRRTG